MTNPKTDTVSEATIVDTVRVYVPVSRQHIAERSLALAKAQLLAGGWTCRRVQGGWISPTGESVTEPVDEYEFLVWLDKVQAVSRYLTAFSEELLASGEQAVLVVVSQSQGPTITHTLSLKDIT